MRTFRVWPCFLVLHASGNERRVFFLFHPPSMILSYYHELLTKTLSNSSISSPASLRTSFQPFRSPNSSPSIAPTSNGGASIRRAAVASHIKHKSSKKTSIIRGGGVLFYTLCLLAIHVAGSLDHLSYLVACMMPVYSCKKSRSLSKRRETPISRARAIRAD